MISHPRQHSDIDSRVKYRVVASDARLPLFLRTMYDSSCRKCVLIWNPSISINAHTVSSRYSRAESKLVRCVFLGVHRSSSLTPLPISTASRCLLVCTEAGRGAGPASARVQEVGFRVCYVKACKFTAVLYTVVCKITKVVQRLDDSSFTPVLV